MHIIYIAQGSAHSGREWSVPTGRIHGATATNATLTTPHQLHARATPRSLSRDKSGRYIERSKRHVLRSDYSHS